MMCILILGGTQQGTVAQDVVFPATATNKVAAIRSTASHLLCQALLLSNVLVNMPSSGLIAVASYKPEKGGKQPNSCSSSTSTSPGKAQWHPLRQLSSAMGCCKQKYGICPHSTEKQSYKRDSHQPMKRLDQAILPALSCHSLV